MLYRLYQITMFSTQSGADNLTAALDAALAELPTSSPTEEESEEYLVEKEYVIVDF